MVMKIILQRMVNAGDDGRTIDMTPDGQFRTPPPTPWASRILRYAIVVGVLAAVTGLLFALFRGVPSRGHYGGGRFGGGGGGFGGGFGGGGASGRW